MTQRIIGPTGSRRRRHSLLGSFIATLAVALAVGVSAAIGAHPVASLAGSNFEIDVDANLKVDHASPSIDWANVAEIRKQDLASGSGDNSFTEGSKEDTAVPVAEFGSIPPNKSDLRSFGVYSEEAGAAGFLHLFWSRVQDPKGTTNMDFEFNKNKCDPEDEDGSVCSANGVTPVRSVGDLLIIYDLSRGGTVPTLSLREWDGSAWGPAEDLTASGKATGSINTSPIPAADADGLLAHTPRTFGEATVDLAEIFDEEACESFGSAYLKSRSSDSFTAALKDFIAPVSTTISNCGTVIIHKETVPDGDAQSFEFDTNLATDPDDTTARDFSLQDDGTKTIANVLAGEDYAVDEVVPTGWTLDNVDCDDSVGVAPTITSTGATFDVASGDVVECTFTNTKDKASPTLATVPTLIPHDSATLTGWDSGGSADGAADGSVKFELYKDSATNPGQCDTAELVFTYTDTDGAPYKTVNSGTPSSAGAKDGYTITTDGTYLWRVLYAGDSRNNPDEEQCGNEKIVVDITPNP